MMSLTIFFAASIILLSSEALSFEIYKSVKGKCGDLPSLQEYDYRKAATGMWYHQYVSFGQEGDLCSTCRVVARGLKNYLSLLLFDSKTNRYVSRSADLTYLPDKPGTYTIAGGGVAKMVALDSKSNGVYVQCVEEGGQTKILVEFCSRSPKMDEEAIGFYKDITARLAKLKLLPQMHEVPQTDCPPLKEIDYA